MSKKKRKNRDEKKHVKHNFDHLIEAQAEKASMGTPMESKNEIIQNDIISQKAQKYQEVVALEQKNINYDIVFSSVLTLIFVAAIGILYYMEKENQFMSTLSQDLMRLLMG
ncbi:hypothetical protein KKC60_05785 [Patescibacteria group bacterium]|nr:hypothetical protein [Patescibacteria group bacterium]